MTDKSTNIKLSRREADSWRELAATFGIFIPQGSGSGDMGNTAEAIRRIGRMYQQTPERVVALLRPLLQEHEEAPLSIRNGDLPGVRLEPVEALETDEAQSFMLHLPGTRTPSGEARLAVVEFEVFRGEQEQRARPISFIVQVALSPESMAKSRQHYLLHYDLVGSAVLRDWGFSPLDHIDIVGPGNKDISPVYEYLYRPTGQWGYYWADSGESFSLGTIGKTMRYPHLPQQMLPYLQSLILPAIRSMDIFCEKCHGWQVYSEQQSPYWCPHVWWCDKCQRISSPEVRSKKVFGVLRCSHQSPMRLG